MRFTITALFVGCAALLFASAPLRAVTIEMVPVGNAGNPADTTGYGAVPYNYQIGKYEVTNAQYAEFLNAKGDYWNFHMGNSEGPDFGGITRSGPPGNYHYDVIPGRGNLPVNWVDWYTAARFVNWLHNGQGDGDTETGSYTLAPAQSGNGLSITRNPGATWVLPSADEWYKAAYHKNDGVTGNYWDYPTRSNTEPTGELPGGFQLNSANFGTDQLTNVGAYLFSRSAYSTYDQAGNIWEWTEKVSLDMFRDLAGGPFTEEPLWAIAPSWFGYLPNFGDLTTGFRVALVPEPSAVFLAAVGALALAIARRDRFAVWRCERRIPRRSRGLSAIP
jgi:hypothetical protein